MKSVLYLLFAASLQLLGCGAMPFVDSTWDHPKETKVLRLRWIKRLYPSLPNYMIPELGERLDRFNPIETGAAGFDTDKKRAFVGTSSGGIYCIDLKTSLIVWRFDIDDAIGSIPIYDSDKKAVYFGADDGQFYALHARSGRKLWSVNLGAHIRRQAVLYDGVLYLTTGDNTATALAPENGEIIWQYRRPSVEGFSSVGYAGLTLYGSLLLTGFNDGFVAAIDSISGNTVWTSDLALDVAGSLQEGQVELVDVDATPVVVKNTVIAASVAGGMRGLDVKTGNVVWTKPDIKDVTGLAFSDGVVYAARSAFGITAIDPSDGDILWSRLFTAGVLQDPVIYEDVIILSDSEFGLTMRSTLDGKLLQKVDPKEGFFAQPAIKNGYLLVMGNNGTLLAMSIL